jgi:hypothetical protein
MKPYAGFGDERLPERFWRSVVASPSGCWMWAGATTRGGYGHLGMGRRNQRAGRLAYLRLVGPIPGGLQIDHLCRVRLCVRPDHLETVTPLTNMRRSNAGAAVAASNRRRIKAACVHGHPFTPENTITYSDGRRCQTCRRERSA